MNIFSIAATQYCPQPHYQPKLVLNPPYRMLGAGMAGFLKGYFPGLPNETMGTASCIYPSLPMDPSIHSLIATINSYQKLLHRYASIIVKNKLVAATIVEEVFLQYSLQVNVIPPDNIRQYLRQYTLASCQQWLLVKNKTLFQRKPKNPT